MIKRPFSLCALTLTDESKNGVDFMAKNGEIGMKTIWEMPKKSKYNYVNANAGTRATKRRTRTVTNKTPITCEKCVFWCCFFFILALCMFRLFRSLPADTSGWFEFRLAGSTLLFYPFTLISFVKPFPIAWDCNRSYVKSTQILLWPIIFSFAHHRWASREKFQRFECIFFFYRPNWKFLLHHQSRTRFQVLWYSLIRHFFFYAYSNFLKKQQFQ